ncbi:MAG: energy transducer TonB [Flavobacteriales bacterium]|nr:energy transducer TonB [Flavobacteriales bacterium]
MVGDKDDKRKGLIWTISIHVALIIIFFLFGLKYMVPPPEEGIAINFGNVEAAFGPTSPTKTQSTQTNEVERDVPDVPVESEPVEQIEDVATQDDIETVNIDNQEPQEQAAPEKEKQPEEPKPSDELNNALNDFFNNSESSNEGDAQGSGDMGDPTGNPNAPNYQGNGGTGNSGDYNLGERTALTKPKPDYICNEEGKVVVKVWVNRKGTVVRAEPGDRGTTNTADCLLTKAKEAALKTKWQGDVNAAELEVGTIIYRFKRT